MSSEQTLRLAPHFPRNPKPCRKPAATFFDCFSEKGEQPPDGVSAWLILICLRFCCSSSYRDIAHTILRFCDSTSLTHSCATSVASYDQDADAGRKALKECEPLMRKYDECMFKLEKKAPQRLIRVQEEYRVRDPAAVAAV
jgi:hypothetical protein